MEKRGGLSSFNVEFPELNDYSDSNIVNINRQIYDMIVTNGTLNDWSYEVFAFNDYWTDIDISYNVTYASDNLLSVHFFGSVTGGGVGARGYAEIQKAITIDISSGDVLSLGDFFTLEELLDIIENVLVSEDRVTILTNLYPYVEDQWYSEFMDDLITHFFDSLSDGDLQNESRYFYIKENRIGLITSSTFISDPVIIEIHVTPTLRRALPTTQSAVPEFRSQ